MFEREVLIAFFKCKNIFYYVYYITECMFTWIVIYLNRFYLVSLTITGVPRYSTTYVALLCPSQNIFDSTLCQRITFGFCVSQIKNFSPLRLVVSTESLSVPVLCRHGTNLK